LAWQVSTGSGSNPGCSARRKEEIRCHPEENKAVVRRFLEEVFGGGNPELEDEPFAPDYILHDPSVPGEVCGPEAMKQYMSMYRSAYPDTHFTIEDQIAEGDEVVTRWRGGVCTRENSLASPDWRAGSGHGDRVRPHLRGQDRGDLGQLRRLGHDATTRRRASPRRLNASTHTGFRHKKGGE
jgi:predicted SnoaL-like aldol condensation-catalyzing enzyme